VDIIDRAAWGARRPDSVTRVNPTRRELFVLHHSGGPVTQTVRAIQDWCMNEPPNGRGFSDIGYNFLVRGSTGQIYEGRGWDVVGAHTTGYNTVGFGVCVIGTDELSDAAKVAVRWLHAQASARAKHYLILRGHRDLATTGTTCPGPRTHAWLRAGMPAPKKEKTKMATLTKADVKSAAEEALTGNKTLAELLRKGGELQEAVTEHGRLLAEALPLLRAERAEVPPTAGQNAQATVNLLGAGRQPADVAASLRAVPDVDWTAVGHILAGS
jgi:hypothetical protein